MHTFLRWHYPDQVRGSAARIAALSARLPELPVSLVDPSARENDTVDTDTLVERLATTSIGETYNQYACGERSALLRTRLSSYLRRQTDSPILLVGEAPGYRGARISGIPFTSERQLTGCGPAEATATIVQRALGELGARRRRAAVERRSHAPRDVELQSHTHS